jgi:hypothetical protein
MAEGYMWRIMGSIPWQKAICGGLWVQSHGRRLYVEDYGFTPLKYSEIPGEYNMRLINM